MGELKEACGGQRIGIGGARGNGRGNRVGWTEAGNGGEDVLLGLLDDFWGDEFAGPAPGGEAVDDHDAGFGERGVVVGQAEGY